MRITFFALQLRASTALLCRSEPKQRRYAEGEEQNLQCSHDSHKAASEGTGWTAGEARVDQNGNLDNNFSPGLSLLQPVKHPTGASAQPELSQTLLLPTTWRDRRQHPWLPASTCQKREKEPRAPAGALRSLHSHICYSGLQNPTTTPSRCQHHQDLRQQHWHLSLGPLFLVCFWVMQEGTEVQTSLNLNFLCISLNVTRDEIWFNRETAVKAPAAPPKSSARHSRRLIQQADLSIVLPSLLCTTQCTGSCLLLRSQTPTLPLWQSRQTSEVLAASHRSVPCWDLNSPPSEGQRQQAAPHPANEAYHMAHRYLEGAWSNHSSGKIYR